MKSPPARSVGERIAAVVQWATADPAAALAAAAVDVPLLRRWRESDDDVARQLGRLLRGRRWYTTDLMAVDDDGALRESVPRWTDADGAALRVLIPSALPPSAALHLPVYRVGDVGVVGGGEWIGDGDGPVRQWYVEERSVTAAAGYEVANDPDEWGVIVEAVDGDPERARRWKPDDDPCAWWIALLGRRVNVGGELLPAAVAVYESEQRAMRSAVDRAARREADKTHAVFATVRGSGEVQPSKQLVLVAEHPARERGRILGIAPGDRGTPTAGVLPCFEGTRRRLIWRVPFLAMMDSMGVAVRMQGKSARIEERIALAAMTLLSDEERIAAADVPVRFLPTVGEMLGWLFRDGEMSRPDRDRERVRSALRRLRGGVIPVNAGSGDGWMPFYIPTIPDMLDEREVVRIFLTLPPGSKEGPPVDLSALWDAGRRSGGEFRALLAVSAVSWVHGRTWVPRPSADDWGWSGERERYTSGRRSAARWTARDRRDVAWSVADNNDRTRAAVDGPFEKLARAGLIEVLERDRDRRPVVMVPGAAADAIRRREARSATVKVSGRNRKGFGSQP